MDWNFDVTTLQEVENFLKEMEEKRAMKKRKLEKEKKRRLWILQCGCVKRLGFVFVTYGFGSKISSFEKSCFIRSYLLKPLQHEWKR